MTGFEAVVVFENAFHPPSKTSATGSTILAQTRFREAQKIKDDVRCLRAWRRARGCTSEEGSLEPTHAVLFTQGCVFLEQTCRSSGLNPANERYATSAPTQYPVRVYVTENFTFPKEARRPR